MTQYGLSSPASAPFTMVTCGSIAEAPSLVAGIVSELLLPTGTTAASDTRAPGGIITTVPIITTVRHATPIQRRRRLKPFVEMEPNSGRSYWGAGTCTLRSKPSPIPPFLIMSILRLSRACFLAAIQKGCRRLAGAPARYGGPLFEGVSALRLKYATGLEFGEDAPS
jgi:hypothetical protein